MLASLHYLIKIKHKAYPLTWTIGYVQRSTRRHTKREATKCASAGLFQTNYIATQRRARRSETNICQTNKRVHVRRQQRNSTRAFRTDVGSAQDTNDNVKIHTELHEAESGTRSHFTTQRCACTSTPKIATKRKPCPKTQ